MKTITGKVVFVDCNGSHVATVKITIKNVFGGKFPEDELVNAARLFLRDQPTLKGMDLRALIGAVVRE